MTGLLLFGLAGIAVIAAAFLLIPLKYKEKNTTPKPIELFKKQLKDLTIEEQEGLIDPASAVAAKLEIERLILRLAETDGPQTVDQRSSTTTVAAMTVLILCGAGALYAYLGAPGVASAPGQRATIKDMPIEEGGPTFASAISSIETHLLKNPKDVKGWEVLAKTARAIGDYGLSAKAYNQLIRLQPDNISWHVNAFETFFALGEGKFTPAAKLVLQGLLEKQPNHPAGQYYLGLARLEAGDTDNAKAIWTALASNSAANAPWMPKLQEQLSKLGAKPPKLSDQQVAAVNSMSPEDRAAFINSMMDRLRAKLEENPNDPAGWMMLARSEATQGETEKAIATLRKAITILPSDQTADHQAFLDNLLNKGEH